MGVLGRVDLINFATLPRPSGPFQMICLRVRRQMCHFHSNPRHHISPPSSFSCGKQIKVRVTLSPPSPALSCSLLSHIQGLSIARPHTQHTGLNTMQDWIKSTHIVNFLSMVVFILQECLEKCVPQLQQKFSDNFIFL